MGKVIRYVKMIGMTLLMLIGSSSCNSADSIVTANGPVDVFETYPKNEPGNKVIAVLNKGESAPVIHTRYSKDFMFYKVRLADGREGYVMFGDGFTVEPKQKK
jgi:hypothetical protein